MDIYDTDKIIAYALRYHVDISPRDRLEWRMFCCSLKVLGYDEHTFVTLSSGAEKDSRQAWRAERNPSRYKSVDEAKAMIAALAKDAGIDMKQFLLSQHDNIPRPTHTYPAPCEKATKGMILPTPEPHYIPEQYLKVAAAYAHDTSLHKYLCRYFAAHDVDKVFTKYHIGASKYINPQGGRAVCYPYINTDGRCVDCKIMHINPESGSRKSAPPVKSWTTPDGSQHTLPTTWALAEMRKKDLRGEWCNFGDHLLPGRPTDPVGIVESEKSAIILSLAYPDRMWIAVGSINNLNAERMKPYRGRKITIYPDRDGISAWSDKAKALAADGYDMSIDTTITRYDGNDKDDLADIVIRAMQFDLPPARTEPTPPLSPDMAAAQEAWEQIKANNPFWVLAEEALDLEPICVTFN